MSDERTVPATYSRKLHDVPVEQLSSWSLDEHAKPRPYEPQLPTSNDDLPFARIVREQRRSRGLSLATTAALIGHDPASIIRWERGEPCARLPTILAYAEAFDLPFHDLIDAAVVSIAIHKERTAPRLRIVPPATSALDEAKALGLRAIQAYGHTDRWMVWASGEEPSETTVDHCTCERFHETGDCPCVALVRELNATTRKDRAA